MLSSLLIASAILSFFSAAPVSTAVAQTLPSICKPNSGGTRDCVAVSPSPWEFNICNSTASDDFEAKLGAWKAANEAYWTYCPGAIYEAYGWASPSAPVTNPSGGCGGEVSTYPTMSNTLGFELSNVHLVRVGGPIAYSCTQSHLPAYLKIQVKRTRSTECPRGYDWQGTYCWLTDLDVAKNLGEQCPSCGNPIAPGTGNKFQKETDYVGAGPYPIRFERYYNSLQRRQDRDDGYYGSSSLYDAGGNGSFSYLSRRQGRLAFATAVSDPTRADLLFYNNVGYEAIGGNWRHTYQRTIRVVSTTPAVSAFVYRQDGKVYAFNNVSGVWTPQADVNDRLERLPDGSWRYTVAATREVESYDADGRLGSIRSAGGFTHTLSYDADGRLSTVSDDFGHSIILQYADAPSLATSVQVITGFQDHAGQTYVFEYGANSTLTKVTYPGGVTRQYTYGVRPMFSRELTGIIDESGQTFASFAYDANGQANLTEHAGGAGRVSLTYADTYDFRTGTATVVDALNTTRTYTFSKVLGVARVATITQPAANGVGTKQQTFTYDANGNLTKKKDFNGVQVCYAYDTTRNLETTRVEGFATTITTCPSSLATYTPTANTKQRRITTTWHATQRLPLSITVVGAGGTTLRQTTFTYDTNGDTLTRTVTDPATSSSRTWTWTYDSYGRVLTEDGPRTDVADVTTYTYYTCTTGYQCGQLYTVTNAASQVTTYNTYNAHGQPLTITDPNGVVTTLTYDLRQRLTSRTVGTETTGFSYWPTGKLKRVTQPDASYVEYSYDAAQRLTQIADSEGNRITYTLDAMGNRTQEQAFDPSNALARNRYRAFNTLNQLWKEIGAANTAAVTTTFGYDNNGNQLTAAAPLTRNTTNAYDELNRLSQITDPANGLTKFTYDANDNLTQVTDPRNLNTSYQYDGLGDLKQLTSPDTGVTQYTYDSGGNLKTQTDSRTKTGTYTYDALNRATQLAYPDQTITYAYDAGTNGKGRLTSVTDASGSTAWTYTAQGRVASRSETVTGTTIRTLSYGYDSSGRLSTITLPSNNVIGFGYTQGKVTSITLNSTTTILSGVLYDPFGPVRGWTWGNGQSVARTYDLDGKPTQIDSGGLKSYGYDDAFRITSITDPGNSALSWTYGYDSRDRLTSASRTGLSQTWTYDANGNRLTQGGTTSTTFTPATTSNRLSSTSGAVVRTYGYDNAGNTTSYAGRTFTYNDAGRLVSTTASSVTTTMAYNALGQRVKKSSPSGTRYFVYDESGHIVGDYDSGGTVWQEIVWFGDTPVAVLHNPGTGVQLLYLHTDHLDTPRKLTRPSDNSVQWAWESDPFGTTAASASPVVFNLRFPGQYFDVETGLHYNYFRDYDAAVGRYLESDPIGLTAGVNTYAYVRARPVQAIDPAGLADEVIAHDCPKLTHPEVCFFVPDREVHQVRTSERRPIQEGSREWKGQLPGWEPGQDPPMPRRLGRRIVISDPGVQVSPTGAPDKTYSYRVIHRWGRYEVRFDRYQNGRCRCVDGCGNETWFSGATGRLAPVWKKDGEWSEWTGL